jgi:opacity protein-like surface antigen
VANLRLLRRSVLVVCTAICAAAAAAAVAQPAKADLLGLNLGGLIGGNCPKTGVPAFAPWGDSHLYYPVPNGGFESGSYGWSLRGASVVYGNEPFYPSGTHSLALPSGSTATSPVVCIGPDDLALRMFVADAGGTDSGLRVRVLWYGLLNQLLGSSDYATFAPGGGWGPSSTVGSAGGFNLLLPLVGSTSARIQVTPLGNGSNWRIDDVLVDPWINTGG